MSWNTEILQHSDSENGTKLEAAEVRSLLSKAGLALPDEEVSDWCTLLGGFEQSVQELLVLEDDLPLPDTNIYPRTEISIPKTAEESDGDAWATRCIAKSINPTSSLLAGKRVAIKDNIAFAGMRCLNGMDPLDAPWVPTYDATVATRIMDAGGVILGKSACEAACMEPSSDTSWTGVIHNPYGTGYSCGGSSSGSGRLVATGSVDMAFGCDQGGSVRIPAAFCGLVGMKATWGTVPYSGILGLHADIDHCGPMTKTVCDNALMLQAIAGPDGMDDRQPTLMSPEDLKYSKHLDAFLAETATLDKPLKGSRIGVLKEGFAMPQLNTNIEKAVRSAIADLATLGAEIIDISIPEHDKILTPWTSIQAIAGARDGLLGDQTGRKALHMTDRSRPYQSALSQDAFNALGAGGKNLYLKYLYVVEKHSTLIQGKATNVIRKQTRAYDAALAGLDAIVMPTIPFPASRIFSEGESAGPLERLLRVAGTIANTAPFNATGHPALALPVGFVPAPDDEKVKLPASLQVVGKAFDELACLKIAAAWERKSDWRELNF